MPSIILVGDVNLMNVADPAVPFAQVAGTLRRADIVFGNLECCLYKPTEAKAVEEEGFFADPAVGGEALRLGGFAVVGVANNVNYGAAPIGSSLAALDRLGIGHTGAGANRAAALRPAIVARAGVRVGFVQRSAVYWPTNHEAGETGAGIAVLRAHTAYQVPVHKTRADMPPMNRPGIPPEILTWADPLYLRAFCDDIAALRRAADIVVASCHWGLREEVLTYMTEIARAAIDAGADIVMGHGPHFSLPIEVYKGKPIFYGLGSFCFHTGHYGRRHGDWIGMMAQLSVAGGSIAQAGFRFVRHNDRNETFFCRLADERTALDRLIERSASYGTKLVAADDAVSIAL